MTQTFEEYTELAKPFVKDYYGDSVKDMPYPDGVKQEIIDFVKRDALHMMEGLTDYDPVDWYKFCTVILTQPQTIDWYEVCTWVETEYEKEREEREEDSDDDSEDEDDDFTCDRCHKVSSVIVVGDNKLCEPCDKIDAKIDKTAKVLAKLITV